VHMNQAVHSFPIRLALFLALVLHAGATGAKEESKIQILLLPPDAHSNGNGKHIGPLRGYVRTQFQDAIARLRLQLRGAEPATEHVLIAMEDEAAMDGVEIARFTTGSNGQFTGNFDLLGGDGAEAPVDPRGHYLVVSDGSGVILAGWLYGAAEDDGPLTRVKELTALVPDETVNPSGNASARYERRPNGHGKFQVAMRGVPEDSYELWVDDCLMETITPNSRGNAMATFTTKPGRGRSLPHNVKGALDRDPRSKWVELKQGDQVYFSGPMLAQIEGLNACSSSESTTPLVLVPPQVEGSGTVALTVEPDCETSMAVEVENLPVATYDLYADGYLIAEISVTDDGGGNRSGRVDFDPTPDTVDELLLDFPIHSGMVIEVFHAGESAPGSMPLLTATLP